MGVCAEAESGDESSDSADGDGSAYVVVCVGASVMVAVDVVVYGW